MRGAVSTAPAAPDVVTIGETMALLVAEELGPARCGGRYGLSFGGAESNVAIGLSRLGHRARWIGCVGADDFGAMILSQLRAEQVDVSHARSVAGVPTALMFKQHRTADFSTVRYYRRALAGSHLGPDDVVAAAFAGARFVHLTGITPALSPGAAAAVGAAVRLAGQLGVAVSFDVNYRAALWSVPEARAALGDVVSAADLIFAGTDELEVLAPTRGGDPLVAAGEIAAAHPRSQLVVKQGAAGASAFVGGERYDCAAYAVRAHDVVGAGDAFVAGYLSALLDGQAPAQALRRGCAAGAFVVGTHGDWEGSASRAEIDALPTVEGVTLR